MGICDEDYSGDVSKEEFHKALATYKIQTEKTGDRVISYQMEAIIKILDSFKERGLNNLELFISMDINQNGSVDIQELRTFV
jgi:hypothetical protein